MRDRLDVSSGNCKLNSYNSTKGSLGKTPTEFRDPSIETSEGEQIGMNGVEGRQKRSGWVDTA